MGIAKQLFQLQEFDLEIESNERALTETASQLGESQEVVRTQNRLDLEQQRLEELRRNQHSSEWEIDDLVTKLTADEAALFSGRIKNPKELTNLQHEVDTLKAKRDQLEDKALEIMDQVELSENIIATTGNQLETLKSEWHRQQQQLSDKMEKLKAILSDLRHKRQLMSDEIDPGAIESYEKLRKEKGIAVAKVEQGICHSCRISLPTSELQEARSAGLVQCSSCGRILFLA